MPEAPFVYRVTRLPVFDRNLENLARKIAPCCFLAHVRGALNGPEDVVSQQNVHPFLYSGAHVGLAHNGYLRDFGRVRHGLLEFIRPELAQRIEGTTDSEWLYVLLLSQLDGPVAENLWKSIAWLTGILIVFVPLAVRAYRRTA